MAYFCLCGHKRGIHEDPLKDYPGNCLFLNCGCSKYNSKIASQSWGDKPVHLREFIYQLSLWVLGSLLCVAVFGSNIKSLFLLPFIPFSIITTIFYFSAWKPFSKISRQEKLER